MAADLFHVDGQADGHDEANNCFRNFANAPKNTVTGLVSEKGGFILFPLCRAGLYKNRLLKNPVSKFRYFRRNRLKPVFEFLQKM